MKFLKTNFWLTVIGILLSITVLVFILRFFVGGSEDSWICVNNQWIKHGNPRSEMPTSGCGDEFIKYTTNNFEIRHPAWQELDKKYLLEPDRTLTAVGNGKCSFVVAETVVPQGRDPKEYSEELITQQLSRYGGKIINKEQESRNTYTEAEFTINNIFIHSVSKGYLSTGVIYSAAFVSAKDIFDTACRPNIKETFDSGRIY